MLPYQTLQEAELALGRELTYAETIWFNYSARKSDSFLHAHNIFFLFFIFSLLPVLIEFMIKLSSSSSNRYKIQPKVKIPSQGQFKCYKDVMKIFLFLIFPLQLMAYPTVKRTGIHTGLPLPSIWEMFLQLLVYIVVEDFSNYWIHRLLHCKWGYEKIHHVHHEYTAPFAFAAPYAHWAEVLMLGIPTMLGPVMVPGHMITFWCWISLRQMEAIETHSGYDFPWSPTKYIPFYGGAEYHDYHHYVGGKSQSNFASVFTYCDYIMEQTRGIATGNNSLLLERRLREMVNKLLLNSACISCPPQARSNILIMSSWMLNSITCIYVDSTLACASVRV